jgi:hypothetical protein
MAPLVLSKRCWYKTGMNDPAPQTVVRAFTSYSWSSPTHESWVLNLASRLREDGVDVILDKWDLKPGHDSYQFMESMVTDPTVTKVMMVCDRAYVEKANSRAGGVGTESQIISPELYGQGAQDKYAALMTESDADGNAFTPVFYKGRIFFDFRTAEKFEESYEQLLRWLVDRPLHIKPKVGKLPETILEVSPTAVATSSRAKRAEDALRNGNTSALGLVREYGDALFDELISITPEDTEPYDESIIDSHALMKPYLRQLVELVGISVRYTSDTQGWDIVLSLLERLGSLMFRRRDMTAWNTHQFDAHKLFAHEAFLSAIAITLDEERFDLTIRALQRPYLIRPNDGVNQRSTSGFSEFYQYVESLEHRKARLKSNRVSIHADILRDSHSEGSYPSWESLMQADFVLYLRSAQADEYAFWYPVTLIYACDRFSPFPIFARSESSSYFSKMIPLLGSKSKEDFDEKVRGMTKSDSRRLYGGYRGLPISYLANCQHIASIE